MMKEMFDTLKDDHEGTKNLLQEALKTMQEIAKRGEASGLSASNGNNPDPANRGLQKHAHQSDNFIDAETVTDDDDQGKSGKSNDAQQNEPPPKTESKAKQDDSSSEPNSPSATTPSLKKSEPEPTPDLKPEKGTVMTPQPNTPASPTFWQKNTPTLRKVSKRIAKSFARP